MGKIVASHGLSHAHCANIMVIHIISQLIAFNGIGPV